MTPLSIVFRVDANDAADAQAQLLATIRTAERILAGLVNPRRPEPGPDSPFSQGVKPPPPGGVWPPSPGSGGNADPRTASRPWDDDRRGMGE